MMIIIMTLIKTILLLLLIIVIMILLIMITIMIMIITMMIIMIIQQLAMILSGLDSEDRQLLSLGAHSFNNRVRTVDSRAAVSS